MTNSTSQLNWQFWIDRGGTFTDIVAQRPDGTTLVHKLLSENPKRYTDAPLQGIRELMEVPEGKPIPAEQITSIKMGTTVATNALLERKGDRTLFVTTEGFRDGLRIGYQNRPDIFARQIVLPDMLYEQVVEVKERVTAEGQVIRAMTAEVEAQLRQDLTKAYEKGIRSCAISFIHGYRFSTHEQQAAAIARKIGFTQVSTSHETSPLVKWVSRSDTTVVDAYLSPILRRYVNRIEAALGTENNCLQLLFMQSNGGLTPAKHFKGKDSILSGPAGGIVGAVQASRQSGFNKIITFDMGGTSTDVAHYQRSQEEKGSPNYERAYETEVAGVRLRAPMMAIHTVAAGGGSILSFEGDRYRVGPESAGAYPGPACYRNGGPLTVTDCNVMVGKIQPQFFPQVFGENGQQALDKVQVKTAFAKLSKEIAAKTGDNRTAEQVAEGFLAIAIDNMANAIKKISVQKGYDISDYALCCFGAAGGQHACLLAESLGMNTVFVHPYAGVLSAYGMGLADRRVLKEQSLERALVPELMDELKAVVRSLSNAAQFDLAAQGDDDINALEILQQLHLRYAGTDSTITIDFSTLSQMQQQFEQRYQQQYGITLPKKPLIVATVVAEAIGKTTISKKQSSEYLSKDEGEILSTVPIYSKNEWHDTPVFWRESLRTGSTLLGPAVILEKTGTNILEPEWTATIDEAGALILRHQPSEHSLIGSSIGSSRSSSRSSPMSSLLPQSISADEVECKPDPVRLEIFNSLFQTIAEQMGFTLQNTSSSVNIKERLDFSCAIFDVRGQLVANAPHIPVHLGSMGESVQALIHSQSEPFRPGDTFISNNPYNGGTHLPDITAITPVFISEEQPLFFVASRGHHADIGGITPGSMPPNSYILEQEGVLLDNFKLVSQGKLQSEALHRHLTTATFPARNPDQNSADLQAQIAANTKGAQELHRIVEQYSLPVVQAYMQHVQDNAEQAVRSVIKSLYQQKGNKPLVCRMPMDCGASVQVSISLKQQTAVIDFTGTSEQQPNNFNAPLAVCKAAVLYVFRTLVDSSIPLNAGCLKPLEIIVPQGCLLNPNFPAAVVAGNVETSQAVTDALLGALGTLAASQGTMNNFTFGNERYQYYETICGGSGAGATFNGTDAVQTHMTNSRLTDPEILEMRFPVLLEAFFIRQGSGGSGKYVGGSGVVRQLRFRENMTASLLSGRRSTLPFGLAGGQPAAPGQACVTRTDGQRQVLKATDSVEMQPDDVLVISTPGGGGYGLDSDAAPHSVHKQV